jgi:hypothetical protein
LCRTSSRTTKSNEEIGATTLECPLLAAIRHRETLNIIRPMVEANPELLLPSKMGGPAADAEAARAKAKLVLALHYACVGAQTLALSGAVCSSIPNRPASGGGILPRTTTTPNAAGDPEASDERTNRAQGLPVRGTNHGFVLRRLQGPDCPDGRQSVAGLVESKPS